MKNLEVKSLLESIEKGEVLDARYAGYLNTPAIPDEVFTIIKKTNGEEFKRYLTDDKLATYLETLAKDSVDPKVPMSEKLIQGTYLHRALVSAHRDFSKRENDNLAGFVLLINGQPYSVSVSGKENITRMDLALDGAIKSAVPVKTANITNEFDADVRAYNEQVKQMGGHDLN